MWKPEASLKDAPSCFWHKHWFQSCYSVWNSSQSPSLIVLLSGKMFYQCRVFYTEHAFQLAELQENPKYLVAWLPEPHSSHCKAGCFILLTLKSWYAHAYMNYTRDVRQFYRNRGLKSWFWIIPFYQQRCPRTGESCFKLQYSAFLRHATSCNLPDCCQV